MKKVVVIGGGPAGMMAAIFAAKKYEVTLIEKNNKLGKKLFITGKGRCNITNNKDISDFFEYIPVNPSFLYSSLYSFTNENVMSFFKKLGVELKVERGDRVFPKSDKSSDIIKAFENELNKKNINIMLNSHVKKIISKDKNIIKVVLQDNTEITGDYFIVTTGGKSYPQTGSTGEGLLFSKELGHHIVTPKPALVPIEVKENWIKDLQGLSLKNVSFLIKDERGKILYEEFGEMLFTHFGISGPIVLSGSRIVNTKSNLKAVINLKPALTHEELDKRIQKDFNKYCNKDFKNSLNDLLPQKLIGKIVELSGIDENKKVNSITKEERKKLIYLLQNFELDIKGLRPIAEAIVTTGGINVKEVDPSNMKSKIIDNLYFAGEILDVDAYTGGFNLQIALSTGYLAGISIGEQ
ncbi:NAD(P)/FAD-dependent oxidoreductase [Clostridium ganghwense]|uniref:NAD(P)/FAD-dependent oxidoreductase n=1 Tax=Clostridium ganghwense TaxID=312089 RepID=A0ABT4CWH5_9CLOT|nr:NAD(P)/FAD-dependent oxidoreductase [Clostridium ganghwense]MCY6372551.1 NAD(P)/FAD-dependent oxidoreductase [Clostridium ganghwense]